jgi:hypothetical protein
MQEPGPVRGGKTCPLQFASVIGTAVTNSVACEDISQWLCRGLFIIRLDWHLEFAGGNLSSSHGELSGHSKIRRKNI